MKRMIPMLLASSVVGLSGCGGGSGSTETTTGGGGGGGGTVAGLDMPVTLSVVTPKETSSNARVMGLKANYKAVLAALSDPGTDYSTDVVHTHVFDKSIESLSTVNMILCVMDQTRAADMVNKGAYIALVNNAKCETGKNQSSSGESGQSSGQTVEFEKWTINSTRADNSSPMIVKIWMPKEKKSGGGNTSASGGDGSGGGSNPMDEQQILVETTVTDAVSDSNPFGKFTLNFKGVVDGSVVGGTAGIEVPMMKGALFTVSNSDGKPEFKFIDLAGAAMGGLNAGMDFSREESSHVLLDDANGNTGKAMTHSAESYSYDDDMDPGTPKVTQSNSDTFAVAFNSANFLRQFDSSDDTKDDTICTSRTDFNSSVWRYNLYHAANGTFNGKAVTAGQRVELESGFPFTYDGKYGHVGYWGVWYEGGDLPDGTTIKKVDFSAGTSTDYTVNVAPGRLVHRQASQEALSQYQGYEFNYWGQHPVYSTYYGQFHVTVNSSNNFVITDAFAWGDNGPVTSTTIDHDNDPSTTQVDVAAPITLSDGQYMWLWSDALGGNITYVQDASVTDASLRQVTLYSQDYVLPTDSVFGSGNSVTVYCYEHCAKGGLVQSGGATGYNVDSMTSQDELFYPPITISDWSTTPPTMSSPPYAYTVEKSGGKVIVKDHLGNLVSADGLNLTALGYDWGLNTAEMVISTAGINAPWDVFQAADSYRWETGSNQWNKQITVVKTSDGSYASFDKPLEFNYTHSTANDANGDTTFDGKKFRLQYGGPGELWGFPWVNDADGRWHASVTLADQAVLTDGTHNFVIKGMEKEQTMKDQDDSSCSALNVNSLATTLPLPTAADIGTVSFKLSDKPVVTAAPAVIEGELQ